jgi:Tfp pilus assembly protein PilF
MALAIQPNSADARYNFALALKGAGYVPDALNELRHFVEAHPDEVRGQLALANLYAQKLHDTAQARDYYRKVLELEPDGGQAAEIRSWLAAHSN